MGKLSISVIHKWGFYFTTVLATVVLISFQNCGKVKFSAPRNQAVVPQSCGTISMSPQSGIYPTTEVTFSVTPPNGITISNITWDISKGNTTVHTSTTNPVVHTFNAANEGGGDYTATASFIKSDGNGCELVQSFQVLTNDLCADPSGISGPSVGFVGEETSPFSVNSEACFTGTTVWDMDNDGIAEYTVPADEQVTHTYTTPGTYTVRGTVINSSDNSQTILTHIIEIRNKSCINPFTNQPVLHGQTIEFARPSAECGGKACDKVPRGCNNGEWGGDTTFTENPATCPVSQVCPCTNGATNPPACDQCPQGQSLVNGQCVGSCPNGATNPPACNQCPTGQIFNGTQCIPPQGCNVQGIGMAHGETRNFYPMNIMQCGQTCTPIARTCNNGIPSGDPEYVYPTCQVAACNSCTLNGVTVAHGDSYTFYDNSNMGCGEGQNRSCSSQVRSCNNGQLSGDARFSGVKCMALSCPTPVSNCTLDGVTVPHGQSREFYSATSVGCGQSCNSVVRSCANGQLSGDASYKFANCVKATCQPCQAPWGEVVPHGGSVTAYSAGVVACGQSCSSQTRSCNNGVLSGTFGAQSCTTAACPTNGACGSANGSTVATAPTANLCASGTASAVAGSGPWTWTCAGANGGSTASCSANKPAVVHFPNSGCSFGLDSSPGWQTSPGEPHATENGCQWDGWIYFPSRGQSANATFWIGDYFDNSGSYGVFRLNNPNDWTITATGCELGVFPDPKDYKKKMPNYCRASGPNSGMRYYSGSPLTWTATIKAVHKSTGEVRERKLTAVFKPTITGPGGAPLPTSNAPAATGGAGTNGGNGGVNSDVGGSGRTGNQQTK